MKRAAFNNKLFPWLFLLPQLAITIVFFIWPAFEAFKQSFQLSDAFGIHVRFAWLQNFRDLLTDPTYLHAMGVTIGFSVAVALLAMLSALFLAALVNRIQSGKLVYQTLLIWPYAVAPAVVGIIWRFLFDPAIGSFTALLQHIGIHWNYAINGSQAFILVAGAAAWQQFSYNFVFFLAGLKAIPQSLIEAAALDGAGSLRRFVNITFPLLSPITFFLLVINIIYAFFDTFGIIQTVTQGGPAQATTILVYKVFNDGFIGLDMGGSAAQSVVLMAIVMVLTVVQFRYIEKQVHY